MRTSEQIESDSDFLRLYSPGVLDLLPVEGLWDKIHIFRSSPGGGKTALFRLFSPASLLTLHGHQKVEEYKDLYKRMESIGAISKQGPLLLGITLSCARNYATLEDLSFEDGRKERLLYSLLNARIILSTLRNALTLKNLNYPNDLHRLTISAPLHNDLPPLLPIPGSGRELYEWAGSIEKKVCELIDSFNPLSYDSLEGHDTLYSLLAIGPESIRCDDAQVTNRTLIMLDDVHMLTANQRKKMFGTLLEMKPTVGIWLAERLQALNSLELLSPGATTGREYCPPINLEDFWRNSANSRRFENAVTDIADRRIRLAHDVQISSFSGCLQQSVDRPQFEEQYQKAIKTISERLKKRIANTTRYEEWLKITEDQRGSSRDKAEVWKKVEILVERDIKKSQRTFGFALTPQELEEQEDSAINAAADYFISREFSIPYYYGISRLANLASSNIEQFLAFSGDLFEEIISTALLRQPYTLSPERQEKILEKFVQQRWDEIPRRIPNSRAVIRLLEAVRDCARWQTNRPSAPYAPGVTGIAMTMADRDKLIQMQGKNPKYQTLVEAISACLSYNLLEASLDKKQGQKGKSWMILNLNRWLCLHFKLPLQYGGWRPKTPDELCKWLDEGYHPPIKKGGDLF